MNGTFASQLNLRPSKNIKVVLAVFGILLVFIWVAWTTYWDAGLYGDNVEQFIWVHSLEWGYYKHPPMPTWLLGIAIQLIGPHSWLTNALAAICFAVTGCLTWLIARHLFNEKVANTALVLWTLQQCFSLSAQIYNHNTVLVMFMAAAVYTSLRAMAGAKQAGWWLGTGVLAGCAMLSKYQAALPLFVLFVTLYITNKQSFRSLLGGFVLAGLGFITVFSPHLYWAITHNFPALRYASSALETGGLMQRLAWIATFFVNQIRMVLPLLLVLGLSFAVSKILRPLPASKAEEPSQINQARLWMWGLVGTPVLILLTMSLISGSQLRNHWGVQLFQFLPIWIAWHYRLSKNLSLPCLIPVAMVIHALGFAYYAIKQSDSGAVQSERRADSAYPAEDMANAAMMHWRLQTSCPLKIVGGDFEAGLVSAFLKEFPSVYSGAKATPWIKAEQIRQHGILYVVDMNSKLPAEAMAPKRWFLGSGASGNGKYVQFAVQLPASSCS